jgi:hypothetical protein
MSARLLLLYCRAVCVVWDGIVGFTSDRRAPLMPGSPLTKQVFTSLQCGGVVYLVRAGPPEAGRATHQPKTEPTSPTIAEPSPVRRTPAGSPPGARGAGRRGRRLSPGAARQTETPFKPVRARRCRPSSRSLWGVRIGSFNRRSKRRLSGGRPGRADRGWNLEAVVTGSTLYGTLTPRSPPAVSSRIYKPQRDTPRDAIETVEQSRHETRDRGMWRLAFFRLLDEVPGRRRGYIISAVRPDVLAGSRSRRRRPPAVFIATVFRVVYRFNTQTPFRRYTDARRTAAGRGLGEEPPEPASIERLSCSRHAIQPCNRHVAQQV